jgi:hypothetical protein
MVRWRGRWMDGDRKMYRYVIKQREQMLMLESSWWVY